MQLSDTIAIITGGASGLGEACVRRIVSSGGKAAILDLNADRGQALATELGATAIFAKTDVTREDDVAAALDATSVAFGGVNAAVSCAGIAIAAKTVGRDGAHALEAYRKVVDINLTGTFNVARLAAERMQSNTPNPDGERGVIVNTASVAAFDGQKGQPAYASSKAGVVGLTLPMARDLAGQGIRVNCIAPGLFLTPMMESLPEEAQAALAEQPLFPKRLGQPSEIADLAVFLITSPYMNAATVRLDAGIRLP